MLTPFHLTVLSITITVMLHPILKGAFRLIEKAHQRKPGPRNNGVQLSGEKVG